jgi:hypothetical protein
MDERNPRDKKILKEDIIERLISKEHSIPQDPVQVSEVKSWVIKDERSRIDEILDEITSEADSIEYFEDNNQKQIGITDLDSARVYLSGIEDTPWYEI